MPRFCANLSMLFGEVPLLERPAAAARAGFEGVEVLFPYDENAADLGTALAKAKMPLALINCPPPNYADPDGPRGFAAVPGQEQRFQQAFRRTLRYAGALGAEHIHIMAGVAEGDAAKAVFIQNLTWAAAFAPKQSLTIEPINRHDMPGYFLNDFTLALEVLEAVGAKTLGLQFDVYHAARMGLDVMQTWEAVKGHVRHVQVGSVPDRHEPIGGDFDYPAFFQALDKGKFKGWVSGEYRPKGRTEDGLDWIK
ncbi:hydroxypyruvate isomerase family protein [Pseudooctadecabacter jejudonensis]|uniref:Hydroxypyruvate isomerase n=1 Tax=Pseudooctadecabacter jejudonensis TaxID=1391910 RepID=A0A1Y5T5W4_9RHOB|nr:TIM barrel protein [Pseudooctadecabacter jejudonensis]SLN56161.1 Hydroxypyruvate isomerase [Pseudooctadecabacter jejudonensis]